MVPRGRGTVVGPTNALAVSTQKELFAFARATDARQKKEGALVLRLPTDNQEPPR